MTTLDETLLQKLAKWRPHSQRQTLEFSQPEGGWAGRLTADTVDEIGVRLWELSLSRTSPQVSDKTLAQRANLLAGRANGLLEPLRVIEVDTVAQLRSTAPTTRGAERFYYEIVLQEDGGTTVRRFQAGPSPRREQVTFTLTHEALAKLVRDLTASL